MREPGELSGAAEVREPAEVRELAVAAGGDDGEVLRRYRQRFTRPGSAQAYEERFRTRKSATNTLELRALGRALRSLGDLGRVLDVPAGAGRFLPLLRERAREVVASDVSVEMLQLACSPAEAGAHAPADAREPHSSAGGPSRPQGGHPVSLVGADLLALPFRDGSFDAVVSIRFLHHLTSGRLRVGALRELARVSSRYLVVTFFDYASVWALRQAWCHLRGKVKPWAVPLARFQAEAAQAGLRFRRSVHVLPGLSEEQVLVFEKDPAVASAVAEAPQSVSRRLRVGHWLSATAWLWAVLLAGFIFLCHWWELEDAELILWPPGVALMLAGAALLAWTCRCERTPLEEAPPPATCSSASGRTVTTDSIGHAPGGEPEPNARPSEGRPRRAGAHPGPASGGYALSRHPALLGMTLWLCGFALACELWWMALAVWFVVPGGLWLAIEYTEARRWLREGHAYDLYAQGTALLLPSARSLWQHVRPPAGPARPLGGRPGPARELASPTLAPAGRRVGLWSVVGLWALCVAGAGAALALLKELLFP